MVDIVAQLEKAENQEKEAVKRAKKASKTKKQSTETLEEAKQRILNLKLKPDEHKTVELVFSLLENDRLSRKKTGKVTKTELFELYRNHLEQERERKRQWVLDHKPHNYWIVQDEFTLKKLEQLWDLEEEFAFDTETTGLDIFNDRIVGYSMYLPKANIAAYVPFGHITGEQQVSEQSAMRLVRKYLENLKQRSIFHHEKYDAHMCANHGIRVANAYWDTQIVSKLLNEHESHRLKDLHAKYVMKGKSEPILFEDLFDDFKIYDKPIMLAGIYAAGDAEKTYQLYKFQKPYIDTVDNLKTAWYQIEKHLMVVDLDMERTGFHIDLDKIEQLLAEYEPKLAEAEQELISAFNIDQAFLDQMSEVLGRKVSKFNPASPAHLAYLLYDVLGIDPNIGYQFKEKHRSTASKVLDALCDDYQQLAPLLVYRQLSKLVTTYLRKIPQAMEPATGRLHARFNNMSSNEDDSEGTATGRYSSSSYVSGKNSRTGDVAKGVNLQNLPSRGVGVEARKCFVPREDWLFIGADLSQIEPRVIASILAQRYNDRSMLDFYLAGKDLYTEMAMFTFGFEREFCVDGAYAPDGGNWQPRKLLKNGVLSFLYGSSYKSFARNMKVDEEVAKQFYENMISSFPGLKLFREDVIKKLRYRGNIAYSTTLFGHKRRYPEYRKQLAELNQLEKIPRWKLTEDEKRLRGKLWAEVSTVERQAVNHEIQGTAAGILKLIMIEIHKLVKENGWELNASIHDETIISVPKKDVTPDLIQTIENIFTQTVDIGVPLRTDIVISPRWMCEFKPHEWDFENCRPII